MQLLFLDESGTPPKKATNRVKHFVIGGVIVPEDVWHDLAAALSLIKVRKGIKGELKWRYFAPHNHDQDNPMLHLTEDEKNEVRLALFRELQRRKPIRLLAAVALVEAAYISSWIKTDDDLYFATYKPLTERFQYYLQDLTRTVGRKEHGIIVCDNRAPNADSRLRAIHQQLLSGQQRFASGYKNLIEGLFIAPSHMSVGIQFADMVAGAIWRNYERADGRWFQLIESSFRSGPQGQIEGYGVVKIPKGT